MHRLLAPLLAVSLSIGSASAGDLPEPEIWFGAAGRADSPSMWTEDAPWQQAARKVNVLVIQHAWVGQAPTAELIQIRDFARAHHMQIDLSTEAVAKVTTSTCGAEEGYTWPGENAAAAQILFNLGFQIDWVDMDGPINSGSYDTGPASCQLSIPDLIPRVAATLQGVVALYPNVKLMDVEPIPTLLETATWRQDVNDFHVGLNQQLGVPVAGMQTDITWENPQLPQALLTLRDYLKEKNQKLSVIYDPSDAAQSDAQAVATTVANFEMVEGQLHIIPDIILFTSWNTYPVYDMPETSPTAETWLLNRYRRPLSTLQVQFAGAGASGKLTTMDGKPIPSATVNAYQPGVDFTQPMPVTVATGIVPAGSTVAVIAIRLNTECGGCNGLNHVLFGTLQYQETVGGTNSMSFSWWTGVQQYGGIVTDGQMVGGTLVSEVLSPPGTTFAPNSNGFSVTPGAQYTFTVPAGTVGGNGWFGNADVIFLGPTGETGRQIVTPGPGKALMSTAVTQPDGTFSLNKLPRSVEGSGPVSVEFDGAGGTYRSTVWTPLQ